MGNGLIFRPTKFSSAANIDLSEEIKKIFEWDNKKVSKIVSKGKVKHGVLNKGNS